MKTEREIVETHERTGISRPLIATIIVVVIIVAGIAGYFAFTASTQVSSTSSTSTSSSTSSTSKPASTVIEGQVGVYWGVEPIGDDVQAGWQANQFPYTMNYEQLFQNNPSDLAKGQYVLIPWLAENYTESADGLTYVINLRQGIHFHTGNGMTAKDVQYSVDRLLFFNDYPPSVINSPGAGFTVRGDFAQIKNVSVVSKYQVKITLNAIDPEIFAQLSSEGMSILDSAVLESHAVHTTNSSDHGFAWLDQAANGDVGTGPYTLQSFTYQQRIEFAKYSGYWGGPNHVVNATVGTMIFQYYSDPSAARLALEKGQVNMIQDETSDVIHAISQESGFKVNTQPLFEWYLLNLHPVGPLADWRVRQAVKMAIDYNGISSQLTYGYDKPEQSLFGIGMPGFNNATATYWSRQAPNITGAKTLLAEAGYPNGFSVNIYTRPGSRFGINFVSFSSVLQSDLSQIGIKTVIIVNAPGPFYATQSNKSLPGIWTQPESIVLFHTESLLQFALGYYNQTYVGWSAATEKGPGLNLTNLYNTWQQSLTEVDPTKQLQDMQAADLYNLKYSPVSFVLQIANTVAYDNTIKGVLWDGVYDVIVPTYLST